MRKRRSTVYVKPGKDITLYVPSDTPVEVCDYLNTLKEDGIFSQAVMEILTKYVQEHTGNEFARPEHASLEVFQGTVGDDGGTNHIVSMMSTTSDMSDDVEDTVDEEDNPLFEAPRPASRFALSDIFHQARKNAGKLREP